MEPLRRRAAGAAALRAGRRLAAHDGWGTERLLAHRRERLLAIVRHAAADSPYYRERLAGIELSDDLELSALPTLDKAAMLESFDEIVTDPRLTREAVEAHAEELSGSGRDSDPKLLGAYRVLASGGTSGRRGLFVYGPADWAEALAGMARVSIGYLGVAPSLPRGRLATIWGDGPLHITGRASHALDIGAFRLRRLDARAPLKELVESLNAFRPHALTAYPSIAALLAERQLAGALRISPKVVTTGAEVRTAEMEERIVAAWGRTPFNLYSATETGATLAADCDLHAGLHVFEDLVQVEVVDERYRPVPDGQPGSRILITNLYNRTQPLIRYELNDLVTVSSDLCPCGRPFRLLKSVDGRSDDVLELPAVGDGETVTVHPLTLRAPMAAVTAMLEYRIIYERSALRVEAVLSGECDRGDVCREIETRVMSAFVDKGVRAPTIRVVPVAEIPRHPETGKHKLVEVRS